MCAEPFDKLRTALVEAPFDKLRAHVGLKTTNGNPLSERRCSQQDGDYAAHVSLELARGECLGLIGRNGAGKTTLLKMLNGLFKPDQGRIELTGRVGALISLGAGFNPILTGRENIYVNGAVLGLTKKEIDREACGNC